MAEISKSEIRNKCKTMENPEMLKTRPVPVSFFCHFFILILFRISIFVLRIFFFRSWRASSRLSLHWDHERDRSVICVRSATFRSLQADRRREGRSSNRRSSRVGLASKRFNFAPCSTLKRRERRAPAQFMESPHAFQPALGP